LCGSDAIEIRFWCELRSIGTRREGVFVDAIGGTVAVGVGVWDSEATGAGFRLCILLCPIEIIYAVACATAIMIVIIELDGMHPRTRTFGDIFGRRSVGVIRANVLIVRVILAAEDGLVVIIIDL
jgi:hypothetical protein